MNIIETHQLCRTFTVRRKAAGRTLKQRTQVHAVTDLTMTVAQGESVGYIGANGAGKSTTIKMLLGILQPTSGTCLTHGVSPLERRVHVARRTGVVFGQRSGLWWDLALRESFTILGAIHRMSDTDIHARSADLIDRLELGGFLDTPVRQLSLGQRMRGEIAAALLHRPALVVLDEPTIGLDVLSKRQLRNVLRSEQHDHGVSLLLTTHDMDDIAELCDRVVVVDHGRMAFSGTLGELADRTGHQRVLRITTDTDDALAKLDSLTGASAAANSVDAAVIDITFDPSVTTLPDLLAQAMTRVAVVDLSLAEPDIEDIVGTLYGQLQTARSTHGSADDAGSAAEHA